MTVGELIKILEKFNPKVHVVVCDDQGYRVVSHVEGKDCNYYFHGGKQGFVVEIV